MLNSTVVSSIVCLSGVHLKAPNCFLSPFSPALWAMNRGHFESSFNAGLDFSEFSDQSTSQSNVPFVSSSSQLLQEKQETKRRDENEAAELEAEDALKQEAANGGLRDIIDGGELFDGKDDYNGGDRPKISAPSIPVPKNGRSVSMTFLADTLVTMDGTKTVKSKKVGKRKHIPNPSGRVQKFTGVGSKNKSKTVAAKARQKPKKR